MRLSPRMAGRCRAAVLLSSAATCLLILVACGASGAQAGEGAPAAGPARVDPLTAGIDDVLAGPGTAHGSIVLRFTAPLAEPTPVTAYEVRASIRHLATEADLQRAVVVPQTHTPGAPGTAEVITLTGLEPGQTLQFAVRAVRSGGVDPLVFAVSGRVAGKPYLADPVANVIDGPTTIRYPGTYRLSRDIAADGTAITIESKDVTINLNGHTVTYGRSDGLAYGIAAEEINGEVVVRNGKIVQGSGSTSSCHGVRFRGVSKVRISGVEVTVQGADADGIFILSSDDHVRVDHCTVHCRTTRVSDRHYPGVSAIRINDSLKSAEIDHNLIAASPQWGLNLQGRMSQDDVLVHHNIVRGTKALVANGYMLGIYKRNADVFENDLVGESRGIHIGSDRHGGLDCRIHDNVLWVQDQTNPEYSTHHWVHGIKVEGATGCKVYDNVVTGVADDQHAQVDALDLGLQNSDLGDVEGVEILRNRVTAIARTTRFVANAFMYSQGPAGATNDLVVRHNVFKATDRIIMHYWAGGRGPFMQENVLLRDLTLGAAHEFLVEEFGNGGEPNPGNRMLDSYTPEDVLDIYQYHGANTFDASREWTLTVLASGKDGAPIPDATVTVTQADGAPAFSARTDARGLARGTVVQTRITRGPLFDHKGPHTVSVQKTGFNTVRHTLSVTGRRALRVDLSAGSAVLDTAPPTAADTLRAHPLSASRVFLQWSGGSDDVDIASWLIYVDDELAGITDAASFVVPGLPAGSSHAFAVRALDCAGNLSTPTTARATTRPEDRGP